MKIENYFDFSSNFSSGTSAILSKKEIIPKEIQHNEKVFLFSNMFNFKTNKITIPSQTHSDNCQIVKKNGSYLDTDGLITDNLNLILSLSVADCCPIYIEDTRNNSFGLIHSGWKGTANKIVLNAVNIFIENGSNISDLTIYLGPTICECWYEVGVEVAVLFDKICKLYIGPSKFYINIKGQIILNSGICINQITSSNICTFEDKDCESYRRDSVNSGRMIALFGKFSI